MSLIDAYPPCYSLEDRFLNVSRLAGSSGMVQDGIMQMPSRQPVELLMARYCGYLHASVGKPDRFPKEKSAGICCLA